MGKQSRSQKFSMTSPIKKRKKSRGKHLFPHHHALIKHVSTKPGKFPDFFSTMFPFHLSIRRNFRQNVDAFYTFIRNHRDRFHVTSHNLRSCENPKWRSQESKVNYLNNSCKNSEQIPSMPLFFNKNFKRINDDGNFFFQKTAENTQA